MEKLYIVIPAYNEEVMIESVIRHWHPVVEKIGPESRLVVIDDGSKDKTYEIIKNCMDRYPQLIGLTKENGGHGATVRFGYAFAIEEGADYIFQTDSDGQTRAEEFDAFWEKRKDASIIIGNRKHRQDGISRIIVTKVLKAVIAVMFHVNVIDANTPYRLINANVLSEQMHLIPEDFNLTNVLLSVIFTKRKLGVIFLPITFLPRQGGVNSINIKKIFKMGMKALQDFYYLNKKI